MSTVAEPTFSAKKKPAFTLSWIAGEWAVPTGAHQPIVNPANGETLATLPYAGAAEVNRAAKAAHEAWLSWREIPVVDRVQPLYRFKALL
jgi:malonate-semialdehyde dehydrogenase (acetylating)/methylmalonate-semialdehyde dehydrogenase